LRIPKPLTAAPAISSPAATSIASWKASVEACWAAARTSGETSADGWLRGATALRNAREPVSTLGTCWPMVA
jgi:hypothetical protein